MHPEYGLPDPDKLNRAIAELVNGPRRMSAHAALRALAEALWTENENLRAALAIKEQVEKELREHNAALRTRVGR